VQVRIASNQLHFELTDNRWKDNVEEVWVELGPNGKSIGTMTKTVGMDVPQESFDQLVNQGISFGQTLKLRDDAVGLRLVVRDGGSGAIGSVNVPLTGLFPMANSSAVPIN
jgi:hypothetical protein